VADMFDPAPGGAFVPRADSNNATWRTGGAPGGGGYGTARGMAALYQTLLAGGALGDRRILSPRTIAWALRDHTGERVDEYMGMPMHRGLGPHLRGTGPIIRGLGTLAAPGVYGHGGVGSSYCWADPTSGVSFAYVTNSRIPDPWHSVRMNRISDLVHAAILD
jgi:CubicO group peptidase (beta-lactamase class C family)